MLLTENGRVHIDNPQRGNNSVRDTARGRQAQKQGGLSVYVQLWAAASRKLIHEEKWTWLLFVCLFFPAKSQKSPEEAFRLLEMSQSKKEVFVGKEKPNSLQSLILWYKTAMKTAGSNLQTPIRKPCSLNHYMCHLKNKTKPTVCRNQSPNITNNLISASVVQNMIKKWHLRSEVHQRSTWISSHTPLTCTDAKYNNNDFKKIDILTCYNISLAASALTHARLFFILFFHVTTKGFIYSLGKINE